MSDARRPMSIRARLWCAVGGALGAAAWAAKQPLDKRVTGSGYDDVELLGRAMSDDGRWRLLGWAAHAGNGAVFGLAYSEFARRTPTLSPMRSAMLMAQAEHLGLYPFSGLVDHFHPARAQLARTFGVRPFLQATWRHAILGIVLGLVARRALARDASRGTLGTDMRP